MACDDGRAAGGGRRRPWTSATLLRLAIIGYAVLLVAITLLPIRWDPWRVHYLTEDYTPQPRRFVAAAPTPFPEQPSLAHAG
jgi:hypothetical protein